MVGSFLKNTHKLTLALSAIFLVITLTAGSLAMATRGLPEKPVVEQEAQDDYFPVFDTGPELEAEPMSYTTETDRLNVPSYMQAVILAPGVDFLKDKAASAEALQSETEKAIAAARDAGVNTVIIDTRYDGRVIYRGGDVAEEISGFDLMGYLVERCRDANLYTYAIFDLSAYAASETDSLSEELADFCAAYAVDGIVLDGLAQAAGQATYAEYMELGGSIGFDNYAKGAPAALLKTSVDVIRKAAPGMQAGFFAEAEDLDYVSNKSADFTALKLGGEEGVFEQAALLCSSKGIAVYAYHSVKGDKLSEDAGDLVGGNIFLTLSAAAEADLTPANAAPAAKDKLPETTALSVKPDAEQKSAAPAQLSVTKPEKTSYTTFEQYVTFSGSANPELDLTINGKRAEVDKGGYFSSTQSLEIGENTFVIAQNGNEKRYSITRQVQIIKEISPTGVIMAESDMSITITAVAFSKANVYAMVNGEKVPMTVDSDASLNDSSGGFEVFTGEYIAPQADDDEVMILGGVAVYGSYNGQNEVMEGAYLKVNKSTPSVPANSIPVTVGVDQAKTYSVKTANNVPDPALYPLPKGAKDYVVGDRVVYKKNKNETFTYAVLASGVRVESKDLRKATSGPSNNSVSRIRVEEPGDGFTYVRLTMSQQVSYKFSYRGNRVEITLNYTGSTPNDEILKANKLFTKAEWSEDAMLTLRLVKSGAFMGYKGYYENGELVFRFNQVPSSIKSARIAIDPGHGGKDPGAAGYSKNMPESVIVRAISEIIATELKNRGATVKLLDSADRQGPERAAMAESFKADLLVSIHGNSSANTSATGTEVYYFNSFSKPLAQAAAANVSKQLSTVNRGAKPSYYHVTLSPQMSSVLIETGFLSNQTEYKKLTHSTYQKRVAKGVADAIELAIKAAGGSSNVTSTSASSASASVSDAQSVSEGVYDDEALNDQGIALAGAGEPIVDTDYLEIYKGNYERVYITTKNGRIIRNADFKWTSDNTTIASVDKYGVIRGKNAGSTTITATAGDYELYCDVVVTNTKVALKSIYLSDTTATIVKGKTYKLTAELSPTNTTDKTILWRTNDSVVATVDDTGVVKGINPGKATITARNSTGAVTAKCTVEVVRTGINIDEIEMDYDEWELTVGDEDVVGITLYPKNATETDINWTSSNSSVVSVDSNGNIVALKRGSATIRAESAASKRIYAQCKITVYN